MSDQRREDWWNDPNTSSEQIEKRMRYIRQQDGSDSDISDLREAHERAKKREIIQNSDRLD